MMVGKVYNIWYSSCSGLLHMELYRYASNFLFLSEAWKSLQVVHGKSIRNHSLAIRLIQAVYGHPGVFGPHGRKIS